MTTRSPAHPTARTVLFLSALTLLITGAVLYAGPLNPPAGPVTGTYKTLTEVEPCIAINATNTPGDADSTFKITAPGSYYLTGNITGVAGKHGIEITSSGVTINLKGFDLVGFLGLGNADGVSVTVSGLTNITILNGSVRNWNRDGISCGTVAAACRVDGVVASGNIRTGIHVGAGAVVTHCSVSGGQRGIYTGNGSQISNCTVAGASVAGISGLDGTNITNCSSRLNAGIGIESGNGCTLTGCSASVNTAAGIVTLSGSTVINCTSLSNSSNGISAGSYCVIESCTVRLSMLDGILCDSGCVIRGNNCSLSGANAGNGAGVHTTGTDNRIEGNSCLSSDRGVDVDGGGNIIIKNTCASNVTNWTIAPLNVYGQIVNLIGAATPAVSGPVAPSTLTSTDPNANFTY